LGHTIYYFTHITDWKKFLDFLALVCAGVGFSLHSEESSVVVSPPCPHVEELKIKRHGAGFVKTNFVEPCHSIYLLMLYAVSSFGSADVWED